ncbi:DNA alkylation repair protein [Pontibacillus yanchengensis]|uniref:DNA alkylation repair protein n=1 Tax=Pontibacillus yanchengensis Y32 TaxID=1385514 RepID=A0A0A2TBJ9_9BACI|nr:DNA alkylation repair protein [Pontibacillus yanchengensis]KGP71441.1 hypothetical protein N782_19305 [Pontibacillus yanchengensis Y32]
MEKHIQVTDNIIEALEHNANEDNQRAMESYMKEHFSFFGIKSPERTRILKPILKEYGKLNWEEARLITYRLWDHPSRECQYAALSILEKQKKNLPCTATRDIEYWVTHKSWWDTVDFLSSHISGAYFLLYPDMLEPKLKEWIESDNLWLRRTALLTQLKYKEQTNEELLFYLIRVCKDEKEFFIQKAIGWALREYSKTQAESVKKFISQHNLSSLSKREGLKWLQNQSNKQSNQASS